MKAIVIERAEPRGPVTPQVSLVEDWPDPGDPAPGQLRVRTEASALNHMDLWTGMGIPGVDIVYPHVGGVDGCGVVEAVGEGVDPSWLGCRVVHNAAVEVPGVPSPAQASAATEAPHIELIGEHSPGTHRAAYCIPVANAVEVGERDPKLAAAIGLTALTAYSMMFTKGGLRPGQTVLVTGIGGGVATAALGLARWFGCRILVTSRHPHKLDLAVEHGADLGILDEGQDWSPEVRGLTDKRGVDMVVDTIGAPAFAHALRSLSRGGVYVTAGATAGGQGDAELHRVFWNQLRVLGSTMGSNDEFREVMAIFLAGHLHPILDSVHTPHHARDAWHRLESGEQMGKIVLDWR